MSEPPEENFCGYGQTSNQSQSGYGNQEFSQKRKYPENSSRGAGNFYPKRGSFNNNRGGNYNNNRGNYNNNRGNYNNNRGSYNNNNRGSFNNSGGGGGTGFYVNNRGNGNSSNYYRKNQSGSGSDNFDPKCFYHPSMVQDPWKNL